MSTTYLDRSNTHILIIDDDDRIRELLSRYLTKHGYRTSTANGADEARQKMQGLKYDLLIVDIMMPGEDGLSVSDTFLTGLPRRSNYLIDGFR